MRRHRLAQAGAGRLTRLRLIVGPAEAGHGEGHVGEGDADHRDAAAVDAARRSAEVETGHALQDAEDALLHRVLVGHIARGRHAEVARSEEHTSELQSLMRTSYPVSCL